MPQIRITPRVIAATKSMRVYLDLLWLLRAKRGTTSELCQRHRSASRRTVNDVCNAFWKAGLIHPCGWQLCGRYWCAVWKNGPGEAPPIPGQSTPPVPPIIKRRRDLSTFLLWWQKLAEPSTAVELAAYTGMSDSTLSPLNEHARARRMVRICDWLADMPPCIAVYQRGNGGDAPRPKPKTVVEVNRAYRARRRNDAEARSLHMVMYQKPATTDTTAGQPA